ncbi:MAG: T9SS type A sorting domain-containing protein, partial [Bacteroidales bacterium]|nr:T9SS type A sorting domain-containing protein [Bacteroidales bacterium]
YRYAVATYDSCGNVSAMSDSHRTIHLQISLGQGNSRNLLWTDYEGIEFSTYRVYRGTSIDDMEMIMEMSRENHTYTDFNTEHDYYYQIEIVQGRSLIVSKSNIVSSNPNAIEIELMSAEISLFPNPANDILNISSSETISEIEIVNTLGQVVKRIEVNSDNAVCDVEELKAGVYVVRIRTASATLSQRKFIKE